MYYRPQYIVYMCILHYESAVLALGRLTSVISILYGPGPKGNHDRSMFFLIKCMGKCMCITEIVLVEREREGERERERDRLCLLETMYGFIAELGYTSLYHPYQL